MRGYQRRVLILMVFAIFLSGIVTYYTMKAQEYAAIGEKVVTREEVHRISELLAELEKEEGEWSRDNIMGAISDLQEYYQILRQVEDQSLIIQYRGRTYNKQQVEDILSSYSYSGEQAQNMIKTLNIVLDRMNYVSGYGAYIEKIHQNVQDMLNIQFFEQNRRNSILKAEKDYYGLEQVELSLSLDVGLDKLMESHISNIIGISFGILCAYLFAHFYLAGMKNGSDSWYGLGIASLLVMIGAAGIFSAELLAVDNVWSLGNLSRSVQSVMKFQSSPYLISVGVLLGIRILFKCFVVLLFFLISGGLFFLYQRRDKWGLVMSGLLFPFVLLDFIRYERGLSFSLRGYLHTEEIWGTYGNVNVFGWPVSKGVIVIIAAITWMLLLYLFAYRQERVALLGVRRQAEQQYFQEVDTKYTQTRMLRHDIHNHLAAMAILLREKKVEDAEKYLSEIMEYYETTKPPVRTGLNVLDAVLFGKCSHARDQGICVELDFQQGLASWGIPDYELCSIFCNLLDNGITACEKLEEDKRWIRLKVSSQLEMLCIFCENPYSGLKKENGRLVTQKEDRMNHGMGLSQIERIARAHNGTVDISTGGGIFSVSVLLGDGKAGEKN